MQDYKNLLGVFELILCYWSLDFKFQGNEGQKEYITETERANNAPMTLGGMRDSTKVKKGHQLKDKQKKHWNSL